MRFNLGHDQTLEPTRVGNESAIMLIVIWELWEHEEPGDDCVCLSYFPSGAADQALLPSHARKIWSVNASSLIDAMNKRNQHLGWAPYQPMLAENGQPYPADLEPYEDI